MAGHGPCWGWRARHAPALPARLHRPLIRQDKAMALPAAAAELCRGRALRWVLTALCHAVPSRSTEVPGRSRGRAVGSAQVGQAVGSVLAPRRALSLALINPLIQPKSLTALWHRRAPLCQPGNHHWAPSARQPAQREGCRHGEPASTRGRWQAEQAALQPPACTPQRVPSCASPAVAPPPGLGQYLIWRGSTRRVWQSRKGRIRHREWVVTGVPPPATHVPRTSRKS